MPSGRARTDGDNAWSPSYYFVELSLSRLSHWLPRIQAHPEVVQGTTEVHHQIADALLPQADPVFHNAAALDTTVDQIPPDLVVKFQAIDIVGVI